jgi:hypothetical protein
MGGAGQRSLSDVRRVEDGVHLQGRSAAHVVEDSAWLRVGELGADRSDLVDLGDDGDDAGAGRTRRPGRTPARRFESADLTAKFPGILLNIRISPGVTELLSGLAAERKNTPVRASWTGVLFDANV